MKDFLQFISNLLESLVSRTYQSMVSAQREILIQYIGEVMPPGSFFMKMMQIMARAQNHEKHDFAAPFLKRRFRSCRALR